MHLRLIRHATLLLQLGGLRLVVDPQLDPAGARPPVEGTPNPLRNPLVELPETPEDVVSGIDAAFVTHTHLDHLDDEAVRVLPADLPVFCQPPDAEPLRERGLTDVRPVEARLGWGELQIMRTSGRHGTGELGTQMGPVSGFVIRAPDEPVIYVAGDTIWDDKVRLALGRHSPEVVVLNAGGARFTEGDPITMTADDVVAVAQEAPDAQIVVVHLEAVNHCLETRAELRDRLRDAGLEARVQVPEDGAEVPLA